MPKNQRTSIANRYKTIVLIGILVALVLMFFSVVAFYRNPIKDIFDIASFLAALISIEVGVIALAYAWYVNKESTAQLNEIMEANEEAKRINAEAKRINELNRDNISQITCQFTKWETQFDKMYSKQIEILDVITTSSLRHLSATASESERNEFEREIKKHKTALAQLNEEGNDLHQLFLKSLH